MDAKILRLLIVDPSPDDAELTLSALRKGGYLLKSLRVQDLAGLHAAVEKGDWDAVISERTLPHFGATAVLDTLRRAGLDCPMLVLARTLPDAEIGTLMRAGARDVILKNQMARLLPALERELAGAHERAQHRAAIRSLKEIQEKHRAVVDGAREAVGYIHEGMHIDANKAYVDLFEYENAADLEGVPVMNLIDKNDHTRFKQFIRNDLEASGAPTEFMAIRKGGSQFHAEMTVSPITINGEACIQMLVADVSKRKVVETKLQYMNQRDPLTGLFNRQHFAQVLDETIAGAGAGSSAPGLVYVLVPRLRQSGRELGQAAADRFLLTLARELREAVGPQALIARWGDHEFAALIRDARLMSLEDLGTTVESALAKLMLGDSPCVCRVATARATGESTSAQKLMAALRIAVEPAKPELNRAAPGTHAAGTASAPTKPVLTTVARPDSAEWPQRVRHAIEHEAFRLIYQPIVNLHGDAGEYFEVLVRMVGDDGKLIAAAQFMPPAEESGQAAAIDRWVVKHSIHALAELHRQGRAVTFFINLSAAALRDVELVVTTQQLLHETKLHGKHIIFEIDEAAMATRAEPAAAFMRAAKRIGCSFCIDNFGRVLGATTRLREPPVEYLKLDGALARNLAADPIAQASLKAVIEVAKAMEKKTIAKSVESAEALSVLWTYGVDYVQGHYFQEADADLSYGFSDETTISSETSPQWTVASSGKSR